jgi:4a-hydroxytetrahydrobiopterin dehydratase
MLTRQQISDAVGPLGWRLVLGVLRASVEVDSLAQAVTVATAATTVAGRDADERLWIDLRRHRVVLSIQTLALAEITEMDIALVRTVTHALTELGLRPDPVVERAPERSDQLLELAIDALDIPAVRPFWKAVLSYADEAGRDRPTDPIVDPVGQGPAIWFQQMDAPRPQRNRIHVDVSVPHDEARHRIDAARAAGGRLVSDAHAPAFWVLADIEGNEACITTWQGRDPKPT